MSRRFCGLFKVCVFFAVFAFAAATIPAEAKTPANPATEYRDEEALRCIFVDSMVMGAIKGSQLSGEPITPEQLLKIHRIVNDAFPKLIARIKQAGFYDEYKAHLLSPEFHKQNTKAINARTRDEFSMHTRQQMELVRVNHPRLWEWEKSDEESHRIVMQMFQEIQAVLK